MYFSSSLSSSCFSRASGDAHEIMGNEKWLYKTFETTIQFTNGALKQRAFNCRLVSLVCWLFADSRRVVMQTISWIFCILLNSFHWKVQRDLEAVNESRWSVVNDCSECTIARFFFEDQEREKLLWIYLSDSLSSRVVSLFTRFHF